MVRVFIASYTRCPPWISTHAHFGAFPPSSVQWVQGAVQVTENALLHRMEAITALFASTPTLPLPAVAHRSIATITRASLCLIMRSSSHTLQTLPSPSGTRRHTLSSISCNTPNTYVQSHSLPTTGFSNAVALAYL